VTDAAARAKSRADSTLDRMPRQGGVISRKQILLLPAPAPLRIVSLPSLTATVAVPSIQRVDVDGVPLTTRTPSAATRKTLGKARLARRVGLTRVE